MAMKEGKKEEFEEKWNEKGTNKEHTFSYNKWRLNNSATNLEAQEDCCFYDG